MASSRSDRQTSVLALTLLAVFGYSLLYSLLYLSTPMGRFPLLDAAENTGLARQIAEGTLPAAPFFRAMLYPWVLSLFLDVGVTTNWLPVVAGVLGCLCQVGATWCIYALARRSWQSPRAGLIAAVLFGLNPVVTYFAAEPMDTVFGLFLFMAGLNLLHGAVVNARGQDICMPWFLGRVAGGAALWALAAFARPHYLLPLLALPFLLMLMLWRIPRRLAFGATTALGVIILALLSAGFIQKQVCGQFRIMPTQGAFSLWAGNRSGANGRYYEQRIHLTTENLTEGQNPAQIESELLYRRATGEKGPLDVDAMNRYWRRETFAAIQAAPTAWIGLMARKVYFVFNDFEQYNNKTFAVQKALAPTLRVNPLGWGVTLLLSSVALVLAWTQRKLFSGGVFLLAVAAVYAGGAVLFFVSDRFRLPLLPFVCVSCGAFGCFSREHLISAFRARMVSIVSAAILAGLLAFSRGWGVHDLQPAVQDYVLLSTAAGKCGQDIEALRFARKALELRSSHPDALACAVTSFYNAELQGLNPGRVLPSESWALQRDRVAQMPQPAPSVRLVQAVALWKTGNREAAGEILRTLSLLADRSSRSIQDDALGVLILTGLQAPGEEALARNRARDTKSFYLAAALSRLGVSAALAPAQKALLKQTEPFVRNIFQ